MSKIDTARALTELEYCGNPCLENLEYVPGDAYGVAWLTWCRTVKRIAEAYPSTFGGFRLAHDHAIEFADCHLAFRPITESMIVKFENQAIVVCPTGRGLAVQVPGHLCETYHLPMCSPAGFMLWLCGVV